MNKEMTFTANNQAWKIKEVPSDSGKLVVDGQSRQGTAHYDEQTIYLLESLMPDRKSEVLRHEVAHCFLYATQSYYDKDSFSEEELCEFVGLYGRRIAEIATEYFERKDLHETKTDNEETV